MMKYMMIRGVMSDSSGFRDRHSLRDINNDLIGVLFK